MSIYTRNGDKGTTNLSQSRNLSKSDDRIRFIGTAEELSSHLGVVKTLLPGRAECQVLERIQGTLVTVSMGVSDPYNRAYRIPDEKTGELESEIARMEALYDEKREFPLPGTSPVSARIDVARAVARRAERELAGVSVKFGADNGSKKYLNRLSDYLYVLARYEDARFSQNEKPAYRREKGPDSAVFSAVQTNADTKETARENAGNTAGQHAAPERAGILEENGRLPDNINEAVIAEVLKRLSLQARISLEQAKLLAEGIEKEAVRRQMKPVICIAGPDGNPILVHAMDGSLMVCLELACRKAYTSAAVRMSTLKLQELMQPGGSFCGTENLEGGRITSVGGGVLLKMGESVVGSLGIAGSSGEEDHDLAEYALSLLPQILFDADR